MNYDLFFNPQIVQTVSFQKDNTWKNHFCVNNRMKSETKYLEITDIMCFQKIKIKIES